MIPADVDLGQLASELTEDHVALGPIAAHNLALEQQLRAVTAQSQQEGLGSMGIVVLDTPRSNSLDSLRDVAQDLQHTTGYDLVVVRTPNEVASVSTHASRNTLESAECNLMNFRGDYADGMHRFVAEAAADHTHWGIVAVIVVALVMLVIVGAACAAWGSRRIASK